MKIIKSLVVVFSLFFASQIGAQNKEKLEKKFKKINVDGNEFISKKELKSFFEGKTNKKGDPINSKFIFLGTDKNGDDKITLEEYVSGFDKDLAKQRKKALKAKKD